MVKVIGFIKPSLLKGRIVRRTIKPLRVSFGAVLIKAMKEKETCTE